MESLTRTPIPAHHRPAARGAAVLPAPDAERLVVEAQRASFELPVLTSGWSPARLLDFGDALLRVAAGLLDLAVRRDVAIDASSDTGELARRLGRAGGLVPQAVHAVEAILPVLVAGAAGRLAGTALHLDAMRAAARVIAHLELRARFA